MELLLIKKKGPKIQSYIKKKSEIYLSVTSKFRYRPEDQDWKTALYHKVI